MRQVQAHSVLDALRARLTTIAAGLCPTKTGARSNPTCSWRQGGDCATSGSASCHFHHPPASAGKSPPAEAGAGHIGTCIAPSMLAKLPCCRPSTPDQCSGTLCLACLVVSPQRLELAPLGDAQAAAVALEEDACSIRGRQASSSPILLPCELMFLCVHSVRRTSFRFCISTAHPDRAAAAPVSTPACVAYSRHFATGQAGAALGGPPGGQISPLSSTEVDCVCRSPWALPLQDASLQVLSAKVRIQLQWRQQRRQAAVCSTSDRAHRALKKASPDTEADFTSLSPLSKAGNGNRRNRDCRTVQRAPIRACTLIVYCRECTGLRADRSLARRAPARLDSRSIQKLAACMASLSSRSNWV